MIVASGIQPWPILEKPSALPQVFNYMTLPDAARALCYLLILFQVFCLGVSGFLSLHTVCSAGMTCFGAWFSLGYGVYD